MTSHARCAEHIGLVCPVAFDAEQVRAAFVRCFASLLYTYRKFLHPATADFRKNGKAYRFNMDGFVRSIPRENAQYMQMLQQTQGQHPPALPCPRHLGSCMSSLALLEASRCCMSSSSSSLTG